MKSAAAKTKAAAKKTAKKVDDKVVAEKIEVKKAAAKTGRAVKTAAKATAEKAEAAAKKAVKTEIVIQSPMGGDITTEEIIKKVPKGAEAVYVRVDQNKLWWTKGEENGSVDLW